RAQCIFRCVASKAQPPALSRGSFAGTTSEKPTGDNSAIASIIFDQFCSLSFGGLYFPTGPLHFAFGGVMRFLSTLLTGFSLLGGMCWADEGHHHALSEQEIGSVQFSTSCSPQVATTFNRAVALLHSFQYERTRATFEEVARQDPNCAMAYWGVAMSHYHGLW